MLPEPSSEIQSLEPRTSRPQFHPSDLAARRLREFFYELDLARVLVRRGEGLAVGLYLRLQPFRRLVLGAEHDEGLDDAAPVRVRRGNDGALDDGRVLDQDALYLERADTIAGREDHVVRTPHEPQVAVRVSVGPISGEVVAVPEDARRRVRLLPGRRA